MDKPEKHVFIDAYENTTLISRREIDDMEIEIKDGKILFRGELKQV